jgi:hypothetical protein
MASDRGRALALGALLVAALALGGCSTTIADLPAVGTPADAPERPKEPGAYLPVHDLPPDREEAIISPAERAKIQAELAAARERQAAVVAIGTKDGKAKPDSKADTKSKAKSKAEAKAEPKAEQ